MSLELSNPAGWLLPMAAFFCGAIASGQLAPDTTHAIRLGLGLVLAGPFLAGMNAVVNALFDRDLDAINHSERPLPSGKLSVNSVIAQMGLMGMVVTLYAHMLENGLGSRLDGVLGLGGSEQRGVFYLTIASLALIFAVNAPPLSLRRNTWWSGIFFGVLAVALPWLTGHLLFGPLSFISTAFAICFAFGAVGLLILAALNKVEGERRVGIRSLSALLGREVGMLIGAMLIDTAILAAAILAAPQGLLAVLALVGLCVLQVGLQVAFFRKPAMPVWALVTAACVFVAAMVTAAASLPGVSATLSLL
ncbi:MAG: UbiA family prenyltransferase [Candidatus Sericytochromatia bacterium]|uniref:UbiA family prenyltransferase n=1 Tax=Candidatus Tanganyikabacteria bacterium TaxID=2961651 RepID=A0A938BNB9_9BACT|nr:UbiA family prenyltransferase [Candidatus Tanganyikabacteria bacterium]